MKRRAGQQSCVNCVRLGRSKWERLDRDEFRELGRRWLCGQHLQRSSLRMCEFGRPFPLVRHFFRISNWTCPGKVYRHAKPQLLARASFASFDRLHTARRCTNPDGHNAIVSANLACCLLIRVPLSRAGLADLRATDRGNAAEQYRDVCASCKDWRLRAREPPECRSQH